MVVVVGCVIRNGNKSNFACREGGEVNHDEGKGDHKQSQDMWSIGDRVAGETHTEMFGINSDR